MCKPFKHLDPGTASGMTSPFFMLCCDASAMVVMVVMLLISTATTAETIKVAAIFAKTGTAAVGNRSALDGVLFAVQELNSRGGLLGKKIEVIEIDNHSKAILSRLAAIKAVKKGVVTVIGANWSSHSLAMAPVLQKAKIPMITPYSTNPDVTRVGNYIFRVCFIDPFQGRIMASFAVHDLKAKTAAILVNANGRYSEGLAGFFHSHFVSLGGKVLYKADYLEDTENYGTYLKKILDLQPDVVFAPGHVLDSGRVIKQARDIGITVPILGGDGWGVSMYDHAGAALQQTFFSDHWHEQKESQKSRRFVKNFREKIKKREDAGTALAYDAVYLFADAVLRCNSIDPIEIRRALAATKNFQGVTGRIAFDKFGDPIKPGVISRFVKGVPRYVKTVEP